MIESELLPQLQGYVGGHWAGADSNATQPVHNRATGELLANVPSMGRDETVRAIDAARQALASPATVEQRRRWLETIERTLLVHASEIGRILTMEHGKPLKEAIAEVEYAAGFFRFCAQHMDELLPRRLEERPRDCTWTVHHRPAGVVGLITPWNFPIGMIAKKLSAALAADCASIVKPSAKTPLTMIALFTLLDRELDLPAGKVNLIMGPAGPIGDVLCEHSAVAMLSFTGSTEVGKELIRKTANEVKKLALELGGNAPYVVFEDADLDSAADHLIANKFRGGGQTCVCANRILVHERVAGDFTRSVAQRAARMRLGNGLDDGVDLGPLIDRHGYEKVRSHVQDAVEKGATLVLGKDPGELARDWGAFYPPTVLRGVTTEMLCSREETFGPLVPIMEFKDDDEALRLANDTEFGLAAYLFTGDEQRAEQFARRLQAGHIGLNTGTGPTPEAPFGGMKQSGFGREGGIEGMFEFVETQTIAAAR
jgi:succinate-semialdehyde dehydrogenase / glutarate-semialdehyde dehydrogenase